MLGVRQAPNEKWRYLIMDNLARKMNCGVSYEGGVKCTRKTGRPFYQVDVADDRRFKRSKSDIQLASFVNDACEERLRKKEKAEHAKEQEKASLFIGVIFIIMALLCSIQPM